MLMFSTTQILEIGEYIHEDAMSVARGRGGGNLHNNESGGRFEVDERSGVVRTRGTDPFQLDQEYVLYVKAEDQNGRKDERKFQSTPEERLSIVGGKRAPQFYMPSYEAEIPENQKKDTEFGFVGGSTSSGQFVIEDITGVIRLNSKSISLDRDKYELNVTAVDDGACCANGDQSVHTATAVVVVFITDVNDNKPVFRECSTYYPKVEEGAPNGSPVIKRERYRLRVRASDKGAPPLYADVDVELDVVDRNNKPPLWDNAIYGPIHIRENVTVSTVVTSNNGAQQLASEATVHIILEDVNDEIPLFTEREQETVLEGEPIGSKVTQVNAIDKDGTFPNNQVYYYIVDSPRNEGKDFFEINLQSGEVFTKVVFDREKQGAYALEVEARDGAPSARPNSDGEPNSGKSQACFSISTLR
ncbi:hypothetical protein M8J77_024040 [Diaphorina citri]|nr:hypothetical protein M8J77_024040 [Diaphorina citri]